MVRNPRSKKKLADSHGKLGKTEACQTFYLLKYLHFGIGRGYKVMVNSLQIPLTYMPLLTLEPEAFSAKSSVIRMLDSLTPPPPHRRVILKVDYLSIHLVIEICLTM